MFLLICYFKAIFEPALVFYLLESTFRFRLFWQPIQRQCRFAKAEEQPQQLQTSLSGWTLKDADTGVNVSPCLPPKTETAPS
jgi:hypothetical protein